MKLLSWPLFSALIALSVGLIISIDTVGADTTITWSEPAPIGEEFERSWFPEIYADQAGDVHLVWEANRDPSDPRVTTENGSAIQYAQLTGGVWSPPHDVFVKDIGNAGRPIIVTDGTYAHLIARALQPTGVIAGIDYSRAALTDDLANAMSWSEPVSLSGPGTYWARLIPLPDGSLLVVYAEHTVVDADSEANAVPVLFSRHSSDYGATWDNPVRISELDNTVARSTLTYSPDGRTIIVAWDNGYDTVVGFGAPAGIFTATSRDGGESWSLPIRIGGTDLNVNRWQSVADQGFAEQATVATNGEQTLLVYRATTADILLYRTSNDFGETWSTERLIPSAMPRPYGGPHHFDKFAMTTDSLGRFIMAYVGQNTNAPNGLAVMAMMFDGQSWSAPDIVASPEGFPEYPRLTVATGNQVSLAFFVRDREFVDDGLYTIWTVAGVSDAPAIEPVAISPPATDSGAEANESVELAPPANVEIYPYPERPQVAEVDIPPGTTLEDPQSTVRRPIELILVITAIGLLTFVFLRVIWKTVEVRLLFRG